MRRSLSLIFALGLAGSSAGVAAAEKPEKFCAASDLVAPLADSGFRQPAFLAPRRITPGAEAVLRFQLEARQDSVAIGHYQVANVPIWSLTPGAGAQVALQRPNGEICRVRPSDFPLLLTAFIPAVLRLRQGDLLAATLESDLDYRAEGASRPEPAAFGGQPCQSTNLHTHGLLVSPHDGPLLGDYVLTLTTPSGKAEDDACASDQTRAQLDGVHHHGEARAVLNYAIHIPDKRSGAANGLATGTHPSGIFWYHPHPHGYSASQLTGATTGLVEIGALEDYAVAPSGASGWRERALILKDTQIAPVSGGKAPQKWGFVGSPDTGLCAFAPDAADDPSNPKPVEGVKFHLGGECSATGAALPAVKWLFTVNGRQQPHLVADGKRPEAWRIANQSPTVTYHLSIIPLAEAKNPPADHSLHRQDFIVLAKDGAALPDAGAGEKEILLMPGARIEISLQNLPRGDYALVTEGLRTGGDVWPRMVLATLDNRAAPAVAPPPHPVAAQLSATHDGLTLSRQAEPAASAALSAHPGACDPLAGRERVIYFVKNPNFGSPDAYQNKDLFGVAAAVRAPGDTDPAHAVFFEHDGDASLEKMTAVDFATVDAAIRAQNRADDPKKLNFVPAFGAPKEFGDLCLRQSDQAETWIIENWTNEIHNFHIHQSRFATLAVADPQNPDPAYFDAPCRDSFYQLSLNGPTTSAQQMSARCLTPILSGYTPEQRKALAAPFIEHEFGDQLIWNFFMQHSTLGLSGAALSEAAHDSVPIPRGACKPPQGADAQNYCIEQGHDCDGTIGNADCQPGRVAIRITFNRDEQVGDFVYHCHILEHEDRGMMGRVHVIGRAAHADGGANLSPDHRHAAP